MPLRFIVNYTMIVRFGKFLVSPVHLGASNSFISYDPTDLTFVGWREIVASEQEPPDS